MLDPIAMHTFGEKSEKGLSGAYLMIIGISFTLSGVRKSMILKSKQQYLVSTENFIKGLQKIEE